MPFFLCASCCCRSWVAKKRKEEEHAKAKTLFQASIGGLSEGGASFRKILRRALPEVLEREGRCSLLGILRRLGLRFVHGSGRDTEQCGCTS